MTRPELVVWDCDGVLVDSERLGVHIDVEMLGELGIVLTEDEVVERFMGRSGADFRSSVEEEIGGPLPDDWVASVQRRYDEVFETRLEAVPGVVAVLDAVVAAGVAMCVASSSDPDRLVWKLERCGLAGYFGSDVYAAAMVEHGKPAPDLFLHAAAQVGVAPARCTVVEDSVAGVLAGRAAGMRTLGFAGGLAPEPRLLAAGAEIFATMEDLPELLLGG